MLLEKYFENFNNTNANDEITRLKEKSPEKHIYTHCDVVPPTEINGDHFGEPLKPKFSINTETYTVKQILTLNCVEKI